MGPVPPLRCRPPGEQAVPTSTCQWRGPQRATETYLFGNRCQLLERCDSGRLRGRRLPDGAAIAQVSPHRRVIVLPCYVAFDLPLAGFVVEHRLQQLGARAAQCSRTWLDSRCRGSLEFLLREKNRVQLLAAFSSCTARGQVWTGQRAAASSHLLLLETFLFGFALLFRSFQQLQAFLSLG